MNERRYGNKTYDEEGDPSWTGGDTNPPRFEEEGDPSCDCGDMNPPFWDGGDMNPPIFMR